MYVCMVEYTYASNNARPLNLVGSSFPDPDAVFSSRVYAIPLIPLPPKQDCANAHHRGHSDPDFLCVPLPTLKNEATGVRYNTNK